MIITPEEFKTYYRTDIPGDESLIRDCLNAATEGIQGLCQRAFIVADDDDATARSYAPVPCSQSLRIHDCVSIVSVTENGVTLTVNTDYVEDPLQRIGWDGESVPIERLTRRYSDWATDCGVATVTVTARWGLAAIPASVKTACRIGAKDLCDTREVRLGIANVNEFGPLRVRENPQVRQLVGKHMRPEALFGIA